MSQRTTAVAVLAGLATIALTFWISLVARTAEEFEPPDQVRRQVTTMALLITPGVVGLIGAWTARRTVLVAAGVLLLLQSAISFSGVTLVYLLPALAFLRTATHSPIELSPRLSPVRLIIAVAAAIPVALLVIFATGIVGILLLTAVAGIVTSRSRGRGVPPLTARAAARGVVIVILVLGSWFATLAITETTCWVGRSAPGGTLAWEQIPPSNTLTLGEGDVVSTCSSGIPTPLATGSTIGLLLVSVAAAALPLPSGMPGAHGSRGRTPPASAGVGDALQ